MVEQGVSAPVEGQPKGAEAPVAQKSVDELLTEPLGETSGLSEVEEGDEIVSPEVAEPEGAQKAPESDPATAHLPKDFEGMKKSYLELQKKMGEQGNEVGDARKLKDEVNSQFAKYGGREQALQSLDFVTNNPNFNKIMADYETKEKTGGINIDEMTPEQKEAIGIVDGRIDTKMQDFIKTQLAPIQQQAQQMQNVQQQQVTDEAFRKMDTKYPGWDTKYKESISNIAKALPQGTIKQYNFETLEHLLNLAVGQETLNNGVDFSQQEAMSTEPIQGISAQNTTQQRQPVDIYEAARMAQTQLGG